MPDIKVAPYSGDYSRSIHREVRRYLGYLQQQGKPVPDADLNDFSQIELYRWLRGIQDAFPSAAVGNAFRVTQTPTTLNRINNFYITAENVDGVPSLTIDPESYARMYVNGIPCVIANNDGSGGLIWRTGASQPDEILESFHHRSTQLGDGFLIDTNARFPTVGNEGYDLTGMFLIPNNNVGSPFLITSNTETQINTVGGMLVDAATGDFYTVIPSTPVAATAPIQDENGVDTIDRIDLIWLDVYIGEAGGDLDPTLITPLGDGVEASRRFVAYQQVRYTQGREDGGGVPQEPDLPFGEVYQDGNGTLHYATKLAVVNRQEGTGDITDEVVIDSSTSLGILDRRGTNFGSSREIVEARSDQYGNDFDTLKERIDKADLNLGERYEARSVDQEFNIGVNPINVFQATLGAPLVYAGESPSDDISEIARLMTLDKRFVLRPGASIISTKAIGGAFPNVNVQGQTCVLEINDTVGLSFTFLDPTTDAASIADYINARIFDAGLDGEAAAGDVQGKYVAIWSKKKDFTSLIHFTDAGSALDNIFDEVPDKERYEAPAGVLNPGIYCDFTRVPRVRNVGEALDPNIDNSIIGNPTPSIASGAVPKFALNAHLEFDQMIDGDCILRFGEGILFVDTRSDVNHRRGVSDTVDTGDGRLELEHETDGSHAEDVIGNKALKTGTSDPDEVQAATIPTVPSVDGTITASNIQDFLEELESTRLAISGPESNRTMLQSLNMGTQKITNINPIPTAPTDVASKSYVDGQATGIVIFPSVNLATDPANDADLNLGAGGDVTDDPGREIDGVQLVAGMRVLIKDQVSAKEENGIYIVQAAGAAPVRDPDLAAATLTTGLYVAVDQALVSPPQPQGVINDGTTWVMYTQGNPLIDGSGSTEVNEWALFARAIDFDAVRGLEAAGSELSVATDGVNSAINVFDAVLDGGNATKLDVAFLTSADINLEPVPGVTPAGIQLGEPEQIRLATATGFGMTGGGGSALAVQPSQFVDTGKGIETVAQVLSVKVDALTIGFITAGGNAGKLEVRTDGIADTNAGITHASNKLQAKVDNSTIKINVSGQLYATGFALSSHTHGASAITSGTLSEDRLPSRILFLRASAGVTAAGTHATSGLMNPSDDNVNHVGAVANLPAANSAGGEFKVGYIQNNSKRQYFIVTDSISMRDYVWSFTASVAPNGQDFTGSANYKGRIITVEQVQGNSYALKVMIVGSDGSAKQERWAFWAARWLA